MSPLATAAPLGAPAPGGDRRARYASGRRPNIAARIRLLALLQSASVGRVGRLFCAGQRLLSLTGRSREDAQAPMVNCTRVCMCDQRSFLSTAKFRYFGASARTLYDVSSVSKADATPHPTLRDAPLVHRLLHHVRVENIPPQREGSYQRAATSSIVKVHDALQALPEIFIPGAFVEQLAGPGDPRTRRAPVRPSRRTASWASPSYAPRASRRRPCGRLPRPAS